MLDRSLGTQLRTFFSLPSLVLLYFFLNTVVIIIIVIHIIITTTKLHLMCVVYPVVAP